MPHSIADKFVPYRAEADRLFAKPHKKFYNVLNQLVSLAEQEHAWMEQHTENPEAIEKRFKKAVKRIIHYFTELYAASSLSLSYIDSFNRFVLLNADVSDDSILQKQFDEIVVKGYYPEQPPLEELNKLICEYLLANQREAAILCRYFLGAELEGQPLFVLLRGALADVWSELTNETEQVKLFSFKKMFEDCLIKFSEYQHNPATFSADQTAEDIPMREADPQKQNEFSARHGEWILAATRHADLGKMFESEIKNMQRQMRGQEPMPSPDFRRRSLSAHQSFQWQSVAEKGASPSAARRHKRGSIVVTKGGSARHITEVFPPMKRHFSSADEMRHIHEIKQRRRRRMWKAIAIGIVFTALAFLVPYFLLAVPILTAVYCTAGAATLSTLAVATDYRYQHSKPIVPLSETVAAATESKTPERRAHSPATVDNASIADSTLSQRSAANASPVAPQPVAEVHEEEDDFEKAMPKVQRRLAM